MRNILVVMRMKQPGMKAQRCRWSRLNDRLDDGDENFEELCEQRLQPRWHPHSRKASRLRERADRPVRRHGYRAANAMALNRLSASVQRDAGAAGFKFSDDGDPVALCNVPLSWTKRGTELEAWIKQEIMTYNRNTVVNTAGRKHRRMEKNERS